MIDRRYSRWFVKTYRVVYNVYLDRQEELDLGFTASSISSGRLITWCTLAATRMPVSMVNSAEALRDRLATERPDDSRLPAIELLANTLRFRHGMLEELG